MEELCARATELAGGTETVQIANYLCTGNYAVSGRALQYFESACALFAGRVGVGFKDKSPQTAHVKVKIGDRCEALVLGSIPAIDKVAEIAKPEFKARMVVKLAVAGAFHTAFMAPAAGLGSLHVSPSRLSSSRLSPLHVSPSRLFTSHLPWRWRARSTPPSWPLRRGWAYTTLSPFSSAQPKPPHASV